VLKNIGELEWMDSFHMACMILTGMGPVAKMKRNSAKNYSHRFMPFIVGLHF
jgi:hypothetical protein